MNLRSLRICALVGTLVLVTAACTPGNVQSLDIGDCFDDWDGATDNTEIQVITDVPIVDCSRPHDNEIYMLETLPDGEYPGDRDMQETAIGICYEGFEDFVGTSYEESDLDLGWLAPSAASWAEGDREVVCFVFDVDLAKLTGTMANAGI